MKFLAPIVWNRPLWGLALALTVLSSAAAKSPREISAETEAQNEFVAELCTGGIEFAGGATEASATMGVYAWDGSRSSVVKLKGAAADAYRANKDEVREYAIALVGYSKEEARRIAERAMQYKGRAHDAVVSMKEQAVSFGRAHWEDVGKAKERALEVARQAKERATLIYTEKKGFARQWYGRNKDEIKAGTIYVVDTGKSYAAKAGKYVADNKEAIAAGASKVYVVGKDKSLKAYDSARDYVREHGDDFKAKAAAAKDKVKAASGQLKTKVADTYDRNKHLIKGTVDGAKSSLNGSSESFRRGREKFKGQLDGVKTNVGQRWNGAKNGARQKWDGAKSSMRNAGGGLKDRAKGATTKLKGLFGR